MQDAAAQLASAAAAWSTHCSQVLLIRNVFLYLDRTYVRETAGVQPLWCVASRASAARGDG